MLVIVLRGLLNLPAIEITAFIRYANQPTAASDSVDS